MREGEDKRDTNVHSSPHTHSPGKCIVLECVPQSLLPTMASLRFAPFVLSCSASRKMCGARLVLSTAPLSTAPRLPTRGDMTSCVSPVPCGGPSITDSSPEMAGPNFCCRGGRRGSMHSSSRGVVYYVVGVLSFLPNPTVSLLHVQIPVRGNAGDYVQNLQQTE